MIITFQLILFSSLFLGFSIYLYKKYQTMIININKENNEIFSIINEEFSNLHNEIKKMHVEENEKNKVISDILSDITALVDDIIDELPIEDKINNNNNNENKNEYKISDKISSYEKLNEILDQIKEKGIDSLTKEKKEFLQKYYKK
jgi:hypothetical protein